MKPRLLFRTIFRENTKEKRLVFETSADAEAPAFVDNSLDKEAQNVRERLDHLKDAVDETQQKKIEAVTDKAVAYSWSKWKEAIDSFLNDDTEIPEELFKLTKIKGNEDILNTFYSEIGNQKLFSEVLRLHRSTLFGRIEDALYGTLVNPASDKAQAAANVLLKIMEQEKEPNEKVLESISKARFQVTRIDFLPPGIQTLFGSAERTGRKELAKLMEASAEKKPLLSVYEMSGPAESQKWQVQEARVLIGGTMSTIAPQYLDTGAFQVKNIVVVPGGSDEEAILYARMANGCESNFVVAKLLNQEAIERREAAEREEERMQAYQEYKERYDRYKAAVDKINVLAAESEALNRIYSGTLVSPVFLATELDSKQEISTYNRLDYMIAEEVDGLEAKEREYSQKIGIEMGAQISGLTADFSGLQTGRKIFDATVPGSKRAAAEEQLANRIGAMLAKGERHPEEIKVVFPTSISRIIKTTIEKYEGIQKNAEAYGVSQKYAMVLPNRLRLAPRGTVTSTDKLRAVMSSFEEARPFFTDASASSELKQGAEAATKFINSDEVTALVRNIFKEATEEKGNLTYAKLKERLQTLFDLHEKLPEGATKEEFRKLYMNDGVLDFADREMYGRYGLIGRALNKLKEEQPENFTVESKVLLALIPAETDARKKTEERIAKMGKKLETKTTSTSGKVGENTSVDQKVENQKEQIDRFLNSLQTRDELQYNGELRLPLGRTTSPWKKGEKFILDVIQEIKNGKRLRFTDPVSGGGVYMDITPKHYPQFFSGLNGEFSLQNLSQEARDTSIREETEGGAQEVVAERTEEETFQADLDNYNNELQAITPSADTYYNIDYAGRTALGVETLSSIHEKVKQALEGFREDQRLAGQNLIISFVQGPSAYEPLDEEANTWSIYLHVSGISADEIKNDLEQILTEITSQAEEIEAEDFPPQTAETFFATLIGEPAVKFPQTTDGSVNIEGKLTVEWSVNKSPTAQEFFRIRRRDGEWQEFPATASGKYVTNGTLKTLYKSGYFRGEEKEVEYQVVVKSPDGTELAKKEGKFGLDETTLDAVITAAGAEATRREPEAQELKPEDITFAPSVELPTEIDQPIVFESGLKIKGRTGLPEGYTIGLYLYDYTYKGGVWYPKGTSDLITNLDDPEAQNDYISDVGKIRYRFQVSKGETVFKTSEEGVVDIGQALMQELNAWKQEKLIESKRKEFLNNVITTIKNASHPVDWDDPFKASAGNVAIDYKNAFSEPDTWFGDLIVLNSKDDNVTNHGFDTLEQAVGFLNEQKDKIKTAVQEENPEIRQKRQQFLKDVEEALPTILKGDINAIEWWDDDTFSLGGKNDYGNEIIFVNKNWTTTDESLIGFYNSDFEKYGFNTMKEALQFLNDHKDEVKKSLEEKIKAAKASPSASAPEAIPQISNEDDEIKGLFTPDAPYANQLKAFLSKNTGITVTGVNVTRISSKVAFITIEYSTTSQNNLQEERQLPLPTDTIQTTEKLGQATLEFLQRTSANNG